MGGNNLRPNPNETQEKPRSHASDLGQLSEKVTDPTEIQEEKLGEVPEYEYTKNITRIEGGNIRGGSPGRFDGPRTVEKTEKAVQKIYETFRPKTVITFEVASDYKDGMTTINAEIAAWERLGVTVIRLPVEETELNRLGVKCQVTPWQP